ncbi:hypothetical protein BDK51DRAFT_49955 [Blyttiomyces helicus]|uniref:Uncharacterized protein n=1 Tax=Blyttiomyces helicus TaxID=388810 RepID=A0A4P9VX42_9FUNG|nr:hypothetical protein BDK51DRAFT_49955 [Blyttiomyces helicus]|eukprot:RKO83445.1 hypothetical protein BDK51DRAFT_49955 [Blyttiomyces helicus]
MLERAVETAGGWSRWVGVACSRACVACGAPTTNLFTVLWMRVCEDCWRRPSYEGGRFILCTQRWARLQFLLTDRIINSLTGIRVANGESIGIRAGPVTLVLESHAQSAGIARFNSVAAYEAEQLRRVSRSLGPYDEKQKEYKAKLKVWEMEFKASRDVEVAAGLPRRPLAAYRERPRPPTMPGILKRDSMVNYPGENQHRGFLSTPEYGLVPLINDFFFKTKPTIVVYNGSPQDIPSSLSNIPKTTSLRDALTNAKDGDHIRILGEADDYFNGPIYIDSAVLISGHPVDEQPAAATAALTTSGTSDHFLIAESALHLRDVDVRKNAASTFERLEPVSALVVLKQDMFEFDHCAFHPVGRSIAVALGSGESDIPPSTAAAAGIIRRSRFDSAGHPDAIPLGFFRPAHPVIVDNVIATCEHSAGDWVVVDPNAGISPPEAGELRDRIRKMNHVEERPVEVRAVLCDWEPQEVDLYSAHGLL